MGGYFSGRRDGRPTADASRRIDLAWMLRRGLAVPGQCLIGRLNWTCGGSSSGSISYEADMREIGTSQLILSYTRGDGADKESVRQVVRLTCTQPNYGGLRWWMICPFKGNRVGKLYMPSGGDRFAGRKAWRLGYQSQRSTPRDKPFDRLSRLQKKLGCEEGWGNYPTRPKGMWRRTYARYMRLYRELNRECDYQMALVAMRLCDDF